MKKKTLFSLKKNPVTLVAAMNYTMFPTLLPYFTPNPQTTTIRIIKKNDYQINYLKMFIKILKYNPVRDKILVEKDKHHKNRHAVGMPPKYVISHTYGMLWVLGMIILPISHPYGMNRKILSSHILKK